MIRKPAWIAILIFILLAAVTLFLEKREMICRCSKTTPTPTVYKVLESLRHRCNKSNHIDDRSGNCRSKGSFNGMESGLPYRRGGWSWCISRKDLGDNGIKSVSIARSGTSDEAIGC